MSELKETKKILIEEVSEKVENLIKEPKYKTEKTKTHWKVFIQLGMFQDFLSQMPLRIALLTTRDRYLLESLA